MFLGAIGCGVDIRKIVNEADTKMYENKANFYENEMVGIES